MRDHDARLKLRGAVLRLHALQSEGFTARDLADAASVSLETARDFLKPSKNPYTQDVGVTNRPGAHGRPTKLHVVTVTGKQLLIEEMRALQWQVTLTADAEAHGVTTSLKRAEQTVRDAESADELSKEELITDAVEELAFCQKELETLERLGSSRAPDFRLRLAELNRRLERLRPNVDALQIVQEVVERYGCWLDSRRPSYFEPLLVLFDGISGTNHSAAELVKQSLADRVPVASFAVSKMPAAERQKLFRSVWDLRAATPLVGCEVVMTMDSGTPMGLALAKELGDHLVPVTGSGGRGLMGSDEKMRRMRQRLIAESAAMVGSGPPKNQAFAAKCVAALSAIEHYHLRNSGSELTRIKSPAKDGLVVVARHMMGKVTCVDSSYSETVKTRLKRSAVDYLPEGKSA